MFPCNYSIYAFLTGILHNRCLLRASYQEAYNIRLPPLKILDCPIIGNSNFNHSIEGVASMSLHYKVTDFPFVINK